jgi:translation elongation factor EF-4
MNTLVKWNTTYKGRRIYLEFDRHPGHVDFLTKFPRLRLHSALFDRDAAQSIQAQTISEFVFGVGKRLEIIPFLTKVDLLSANQRK